MMKNEAAFPSPATELRAAQYGLTKREHFAAMAMQGLCSYSGEDASKWSCDQIARKSRQMADALIAELGRTED